jgi:PPOX class probable F420-dependent enzyme
LEELAMVVFNLEGLSQARFIDLVTYRRNGTPVGTPVLFVETPDRLLVRVAHNSGKLKRLRHDSRVEFAKCDQRGRRTGPALIGQARILGDDDVRPMLRSLHAKYPIAGRLFTMIRMAQGRRNVIVEVTLNA